MKNRKCLVRLALVLLFSACGTGQSNSSIPTSSPTPTKYCTATPVPTATIVPPNPPAAGYSNVYGRLLWHGEPVVGLRVYLTDFIEGAETYFNAESETDGDGRFVFTQVPPGDGYRIGSSFNAMGELNKREGLGGFAIAYPARLAIPADTNLNFGEYYLIEANLTLLDPANESEMVMLPMALQWEAYPGAAYYHVVLSQESGSFTNLETETTETYLELLPLLSCRYDWNVVAYNADGKPLARSERNNFTIQNNMLISCNLAMIYPRMLEHLRGGRILLLWEENPLAASYSIKIKKIFCEKIYNQKTKRWESGECSEDSEWYVGTRVMNDDGNFGDFNPPLQSFDQGTYAWDVEAFTAEGDFIASGHHLFHVDY